MNEEDIKLVEDLMFELKFLTINTEEIRKGQALENLMKAYKELEKENNTYKKMSIYDIEGKYLEGKRNANNKWKSKIKEKIEELKPIINKYNKQIENDKETDLSYEEIRDYASKLEILESILEEG